MPQEKQNKVSSKKSRARLYNSGFIIQYNLCMDSIPQEIKERRIFIKNKAAHKLYIKIKLFLLLKELIKHILLV